MSWNTFDSDDRRGDPFGGRSGRSNNASSDLNRPLMGSGHGSTAGAGGDYDSSITELTRQIGLFQQHISTASTLVRRIGTNRDSVRVREQVQSHVNEGTELVKSISEQLKIVEASIKQATGRNKSRRRSQYKKLERDFKQQVTMFKAVATEFIKKEEDHRRRSSSGAMSSLSNPSSTWRVDSGDRSGRFGGDPTEPQKSEEERIIEQKLMASQVEFNEQEIRERQEAAETIRNQLVGVAEIFSDLGTMVEDQGDQISVMLGEVQTAEDQTKKAREQLVKANSYQKSTTKKLFVCAGVLLLVVGVLVAIIMLSQH